MSVIKYEIFKSGNECLISGLVIKQISQVCPLQGLMVLKERFPSLISHKIYYNKI